MRLLALNFVACVSCQSFPLDLHAVDIGPAEARFDPGFLKRMLSRIDYAILMHHVTQAQAQHPEALAHIKLPATAEAAASDPLALQSLHHALVGLAVRNGELECSKCTAKFPVKEFIPSMMPPK